MYILATTSNYMPDVKYYSKSGSTYTLLVAGTDYTIGSTISGTIYQAPELDKMYLRNWGSTGAYSEFPYLINGVNTLPENDVSQNDVDLDAYTNTAGKTIRNRVRHDVTSLDFEVPTWSGGELHNFLEYTKGVWFDCLYFDESRWAFVSKKMYRSGTVKYHRYMIPDKYDPTKMIFQNISFSFIEE